MNNKYVTCISYHATGSGAVDDFFREFDNFSSARSEVECRYLQDPDGISDLEYNLVENPHRLNSGFALKRYLLFAKDMERTYKKIFGTNWISLTKEYIDSLTKFQYKGYWHGDLRIISKAKLFIYYCRRALSKITPKKYRKSTIYNYFPKMDTYHVDITEEEFLNKTRKYTDALAQLLNEENKEFVVFDQLVPTTNIKRYLRYMSNLKVIIVDRDPRDVFIHGIRTKGHVIPKEIDKFCEFYKDIRKTIEIEKENDNVIYIRFEELILNYEETTKKIMNFVGLNEENHINKFKYFNPNISRKNLKMWENSTNYRKEIGIIERDLKDYLFDFEGEN